MGWTTRGIGRTYDSLTGTAVLIGLFSHKIISYIAYNRKCKMCDMGHPTEDHDCRRNFQGSAKSMESKAAATLATANSIFEKCNIQLGVLISDNDSSSIAAIRSVSNHEVVKQADKNHTSKGVTNELYKIKKQHKKLTADTIKYLHRCFTYCISQNQGNNTEMANAIRNIPYHCFNTHTNCGNWCDFKNNPENYKHANIGNGFQDTSLFDNLKCLFNSLANKTDRFSAGASSNSNESFNALITSKAPKSRMYGMSAAGDIRLACTVNKKNDGESYVSELAKKLSLSPGMHTKKYGDRVTRKAKLRYTRSNTQNFKKRRLFLKKEKTQLRHKKEISEGVTYQSNIALLDNLDLPIISEVQHDSSR